MLIMEILKKTVLFLIKILSLIFLFTNFSMCQKFELQGGLNFQTTIMNFVDFKELAFSGNYPFVPYNYERNIQGLGLDAAVLYQLNDNGLKLRYQFQGRYDETYYEVINSKTTPTRKVILNHSLELLKNSKRNNWYTSFGVQVFNPFIKIPYQQLYAGENISLTFVGYSIGKGLLWDKNHQNDFNIRAYYILPGDIPFFNSSNGYLTYSISLKRTILRR